MFGIIFIVWQIYSWNMRTKTKYFVDILFYLYLFATFFFKAVFADNVFFCIFYTICATIFAFCTFDSADYYDECDEDECDEDECDEDECDEDENNDKNN